MTTLIHTAEAMEALRAAMRGDPGYAWSWHCNLAMMAVDAGAPHQAANERAADLMKNLFAVDTRYNEHFPMSADL